MSTTNTTTSTFTEDTEPKVAIDCQWARCDSTLEVSRVKFSGTFDWWGRCDSCGGQHQISAGDEVTGTIRPLAKVIAGDLLDSDELAGLLGVLPNTLRAMRAQPARHRKIDGLPEPLRMVGNSPVWTTADFLAWWADGTRSFHMWVGGIEDWAEDAVLTVTNPRRGETGAWMVDLVDDDGRTLARRVGELVSRRRRG